MGCIISSKEELNMILKGNRIAIYGAGDIAKHFVKYVAESEIIKIEQIYVSYHLNNPGELLGVPVTCVYEIDKEVAAKQSLIVCVTSRWIDEIKEQIKDIAFQNVFYLSDEIISEIKYSIADYDIRTYEQTQAIEGLIHWNFGRMLRFAEKPCLEYMIVHIIDHCNLRCQGCDHFACIADENYIPFEMIKRDIERMGELFDHDYIMKIAVMGGEPLLHPQLKEILAVIRKSFPYTTIRLSTNGLLLLHQDQSFWKTLREYNVMIVMTKYPINLDFCGIQEKAKEEKVNFIFHEGTEGDYVKHSFKKIINLKGDSNPAESFATCHISNYGNQLLDGKFYGCAFSCQSYRIFNKKFNQNLRLTKEDYIDIFEAESKEEFFKFAARPKYYCRYCKGLSPDYPWARSKQVISEWVEE